MYNRYIPQPDGTYLRNRVAESQKRTTEKSAPDHKTNTIQPKDTQTLEINSCKHDKSNSRGSRQETIPRFLQQLMPKNIDTGDLMIIILLLLIAGDCEEDRSNALLTLALYFFM